MNWMHTPRQDYADSQVPQRSVRILVHRSTSCLFNEVENIHQQGKHRRVNKALLLDVCSACIIIIVAAVSAQLSRSEIYCIINSGTRASMDIQGPSIFGHKNTRAPMQRTYHHTSLSVRPVQPFLKQGCWIIKMLHNTCEFEGRAATEKLKKNEHVDQFPRASTLYVCTIVPLPITLRTGSTPMSG